MTEKSIAKSSAESVPGPAGTPDTPANPQVTEEREPAGLSPFLLLCAGGLLASFFMPWIKILFGRASGFDLQQLGGMHLAYWAIPVLAVLAIVSIVLKQKQRVMSLIAGAMPYAVLIYWLVKFESKYMELLTSLDYGGYMALVCGAGLIVISRGLK